MENMILGNLELVKDLLDSCVEKSTGDFVFVVEVTDFGVEKAYDILIVKGPPDKGYEYDEMQNLWNAI